MIKQSEFEKNVYEIIGSIGSSIMGAYALFMILRYGFLGVTFGIGTFIKIGIFFSLVMMIVSAILSIRRLLLNSKKDDI